MNELIIIIQLILMFIAGMVFMYLWNKHKQIKGRQNENKN